MRQRLPRTDLLRPPRTVTSAPGSSDRGPLPAHIHTLQRTAGNRAVTHILTTAGGPTAAAPVQRRELPPGSSIIRSLGPGDWETQHRWEVDISGPSASSPFVTAARYNTLHGRHAEYRTIAERNTYYKAMQWLLIHDPVLGGSPAAGIRFFGAAAEVTGFQGIGGLELPGANVVVPAEVHRLARLVNAELHRLNLNILRRVLIARDRVDPQATLAPPATAMEFDLRMVETEQGEVERLIVAHPLTPYGRWVLNQLMNTSVPYGGRLPSFMVWARTAMGVPELDFMDQQHRMALGRAMVFQAHGRSQADFLAFIASGATAYATTPRRPVPAGAATP